MNRNQMLERLNAIFQDVFDDENLSIRETTTAEDIEEWDSLMHIMLVNAIECESQSKVDMRKVLEAVTVGEMLDMIEEALE